MTWKQDLKKFKKEVRQFQSQDGQAMTFLVLLAEQMDFLMYTAECGDKYARQVVTAIGQWAKMADKGVENGVIPYCVYCNNPIEQGEVGGFGFLLPTDYTGVGMTAIFCSECAEKHTREQLGQRFTERLAEDTGIGMVKYQ